MSTRTAAAYPPRPEAKLAASKVRSASRPIVRTALALLSAQGLSWLTSLLSILFIPRFLGASDYGLYASVQTGVFLLIAIATFGTTNHIVKSVARAPSHTSNIVLHAALGRLGIWSLFFVGALFLGPLLLGTGRTYSVLIAMVAGAAFHLLMDAGRAGLQGNHALGPAAILSGFLALAGQGVVIALLINGQGVVAITVAGTVFLGLTAFAVLALLWRQFGTRPRFERHTLMAIMLAGAPFLVWDLALLIYSSVDYLMLAMMSDAATVGAYALAYRLVLIPIFVPTIISSAAYPTLARAAHVDAATFRRILTTATRYGLIALLPMVVGLQVLSSDLAQIIGGGAEYDEAGPVIVVLAFHVPMAALGAILGVGLFAMDQQKRFAAIAWVAAVLNPALNLAAIPLAEAMFGNAALGAAAMTVLTEVFMVIAVSRMARAFVDWRVVWSSTWRTLAACLVMAAVVLLLRGVLQPLLMVPLGAATWGIAALVFRAVQIRELGELRLAFSGDEDAPRDAVGIGRDGGSEWLNANQVPESLVRESLYFCLPSRGPIARELLFEVAARYLGFARVDQQLRRRLDAAVAREVLEGRLMTEREAGTVRLASAPSWRPGQAPALMWGSASATQLA